MAEFGMNMQEDVNEVGTALKRLVEMSSKDLGSEEDVKIKVVLPILRALGYDDGDFKYEGRTGRGYVDVVVERYPTGIVVESKAPRKKLDNYLEQLETYIFHKHGRNRATVAIQTDGEKFNIYGVTGALYKGSLAEFMILSFARSELVSVELARKLIHLLGVQSNQNGAIGDAIARYQKDRERLGTIESDLQALRADRERIDSRIRGLETERAGIPGFSDRSRDKPKARATPSSVYKHPASQHILRLLRERGAFSKSRGVDRKWLDEQLIDKVEGVHNNQAVSFGIMELRDDKGKVENEGGKNSGRRIGKVWLLETHEELNV